jgi:CheY-like chemotaxis protein
LGLGTLVASAVFMLGPRPGAELIEPPAQAAALAFAGAEAPARAHRVLWVDDKPDNNLREREAMAAFGASFDLALSTDEALAVLRTRRYDLIISDMNRPGDPSAGYTLLKSLRERGDSTRYMIYTSRCTDADMLEARSRGALGCAVQISELMRAALGVMEARN